MTDASTIFGLAVSSSGRRPGIYNEAREVSRRAQVSRKADSPSLQRALQRLDSVLASDQPPSSEVPRGFYINILV
jgi:hypothetical protein